MSFSDLAKMPECVTGRDWDGGVYWTDERSIEQGEWPSHAKVTRLPGEEYLPENLALTFKSGHKSLMEVFTLPHMF